MYTQSDIGLKALQADRSENINLDIINQPLDPRRIQTRKIGGTSLRYITGTYVIELLNEAFDSTWSFEILHHEIIRSEDKVKKNWQTKEQTTEVQPPYALVLGRLTIAGYGVKEQYGSQVIIGGAAEQANAIKGAATDALKKCATLIGIGAELYEKKPAPTPKPKTTKTVTPEYDPKDVAAMQKAKEKLNITDNADLNPYVQRYTGNEDADYKHITPLNIADFIKFLQEEPESK